MINELENYPAFLTAEHMAEILHTTTEYIRRKCRAGEIPAFKPFNGSGMWLCGKPAFLDWVESRSNPGAGA